MSRKKTAEIARILIVMAMLALVITGACLVSWLFFGGMVQMYQSSSWVTVEFIQGITRVIGSAPIAILFLLALSGLISLFDFVNDWARGRV